MCKTQKEFEVRLDELNIELAKLCEEVKSQTGSSYRGLPSFNKEQLERHAVIMAKIKIHRATHKIDDETHFKSIDRADSNLKAEKQ